MIPVGARRLDCGARAVTLGRCSRLRHSVHPIFAGFSSCLVACSAAPSDTFHSSAKRPRSEVAADGGSERGAPADGSGDGNGKGTPTGNGPGTSVDGGGLSSSPEGEGGVSAPPIDASRDNATHGTGGPSGLSELRSTGGLSYQINAPTANDKPHGLLVLLHGSSASNYKELIGIMATVAAQHDLLRVSVLAPNGQGWNEGNQVQAAEQLHQLVQQDIYPKYNIDKDRVLFSGQSSGGGFLSSNFVPSHARDYAGGAFFQCGAAPPSSAFTPDAATKKNFHLHFEITTGDPIWPASYAMSVADYTAAGMSLTKDNTKPGGHCAFDQQQVILDHIAVVLAH